MSKREKKAQKTCENCSNAIYCGDGSCACLESKEGPKWVIEGWGPAEDYLWCGGKEYEEQRGMINNGEYQKDVGQTLELPSMVCMRTFNIC